MRSGGSGRRFRNNRGNARRAGGNNRNQSFESTGPDVKVRGTAQQIADRYLMLARDASSSGDLVVAENCLQHAEHYQRIVNQHAERAAEQQREREERAERQHRPPDDQPQGDSALSCSPAPDNEASAQIHGNVVEKGNDQHRPGTRRRTNGAGADDEPTPATPDNEQRVMT